MKKFTKLFLSCAAVTAVTAAVATSAMAATVSGDLAGTYDEETGKLTLTTAVSDTATVLVLNTGADETAVTEDDILYIDQTADGSFGEMGLKGATAGLADGIYKVKVGYYDDDTTFKILSGSFTIGDVGEEITIGNVNGDSRLNTSDANCILYYASGDTDTDKIGNVGKTITISDASNMAVGTYANGDTLLVGNVNGDSRLNTSDANCILYYASGDTDTDNIGNVGVTITGSIAD